MNKSKFVFQFIYTKIPTSKKLEWTSVDLLTGTGLKLGTRSRNSISN